MDKEGRTLDRKEEMRGMAGDPVLARHHVLPSWYAPEGWELRLLMSEYIHLKQNYKTFTEKTTTTLPVGHKRTFQSGESSNVNESRSALLTHEK